MSEPASFVVSGSADDWISANWLLVRNRWLWRRLLISVAALALFYAAILIIGDLADYGWSTRWAIYRLTEGIEYAIIVALVVIALTLVLLPRRVRKAHADVYKLAPETLVEIDEEGLRSSNPVTENRFKWPQFKRWLENDRVIALMLTDRQMFILPKKQVGADAVEALQSRLIAADVPRR